MNFSLMTYTVGPGQPGGLPDLPSIVRFAAELGFVAVELFRRASHGYDAAGIWPNVCG